MASRGRRPALVEDEASLTAPLTLSQLHKLLAGKQVTTGLEHCRYEQPDKSPDGTTIKRVYDGGRCLHETLGHALLHYCEFQLQMESVKFYEVKNLFILFGYTLSMTPLSFWREAVKVMQGAAYTYEWFKACIKEWIGKFTIPDSRRDQLMYCRDPNRLRMSREFTGVSQFAEHVKVLFDLSNMIPDNVSKYPVPDLTEQELLRAIFDAQPLKLQEAYRQNHHKPPEQTTYLKMVDWFKQREVANKKLQAQRHFKNHNNDSDSAGSDESGPHREKRSGFKRERRNKQNNSNKRQKIPKGSAKRNPNSNLTPKEVRELFQDVRSSDKCPYHPQGNHNAGDCAQNPANANNKSFDKYRPKQRPGAAQRNGNHERRGKSAEAHVIEAAVEAPSNDDEDSQVARNGFEFVASYNPEVEGSTIGGFNVEDFPVATTMTADIRNDIDYNGLFPPGGHWDPDLMSSYEFNNSTSVPTNASHSSVTTDTHHLDCLEFEQLKGSAACTAANCGCYHGVRREVLDQLWPNKGDRARRQFLVALKFTPCVALKLFGDIVGRWTYTLHEER